MPLKNKNKNKNMARDEKLFLASNDISKTLSLQFPLACKYAEVLNTCIKFLSI